MCTSDVSMYDKESVVKVQMIRETERTLRYADLIVKADWKTIGELFFDHMMIV